MSREHYNPRFSDHFANRDQGSRARADVIARVQEASFSLVTPADISPVNTGHSEKPFRRGIKILGPLAVPFLIMACSASSQPQARQIEPSPTVPISTPTVLPTREATSTAVPEAVLTPVPLGAVMPDFCRDNPDAIKGWEIATSKRPLTAADNPYIKAFNECAQKSLAQSIATSTAEAAKPPATPTEAPKPPPTVTPAILETATPEAKYRFATYGVYVGEVEGGGIILFSTLPDGTLVFESSKQQPRCSIPDYYMFFFGTSAKYQPDGKFVFKYSIAKEVTGELVDENTVVGKMLEKGHTAGSPKGPVTCEKTEVGFKAKLVGTGRTALLEAKRNASVAAGFPKPTVERALMQLEAECKCKLPE